MSNEKQLLDEFVGAFQRLDDLSDFDVPLEMLYGEAKTDLSYWRPLRYATPVASLSTLYSSIPGPLPPLFETLLLSYRWLEVQLEFLLLLANPPGADLSHFAKEVLSDKALSEYLVPRKLVRFAMGPGLVYDPICFDLNRRLPNGDCPVIQLDHEDIFHRVAQVKHHDVAGSFEELVTRVISLPSRRSGEG